MKNSIKALAFVFLTAVASPLFANGTPNPTLKAGMFFSKDGKLNINFENNSNASAKIVIKDANRNVVFRKSTGAEVSALKLDIDQLPDGWYHVEISNGKDKILQNVKLETPRQERIRSLYK